jgi:hypothetical protein
VTSEFARRDHLRPENFRDFLVHANFEEDVAIFGMKWIMNELEMVDFVEFLSSAECELDF